MPQPDLPCRRALRTIAAAPLAFAVNPSAVEVYATPNCACGSLLASYPGR